MNRDPWEDFAAVFAEELQAAMTLNAADLDRLAEARDVRQFCRYCGSTKTGPECCEESRFVTGREFFNAHGRWPADH